MSRRQLLRLAERFSDSSSASYLFSSRSAADTVLPLKTVHSSACQVVSPWSSRDRHCRIGIQGIQRRTYTSFWTQSYPPSTDDSPSIPYAPPSPDDIASGRGRFASEAGGADSSMRPIRSGGIQYGGVTVAGHGQNVHVIGNHDYPSAPESSGAAAADEGAYVPTDVGVSREGPTGPGLGRRKERKNRYLDSLMDKAGELNLRCSVLDADGEWTLQEGRFKKAELCKEYDLDPRDLRKLDSLAPNLVPVILTRRTCILISILHVRALIKPDKVIIFDVPGVQESEAQRRFKLHLERNVKAGATCQAEGQVSDREARALLGLNGVDQAVASTQPDSNAIEERDEDDADVLPYEHRALESILVATANALEEEMAYTRSLVRQLLADLEDDINRENLKKLLHYSRRMVGFQSRARYVKRAVDEILDNDEDLSAMYLTSTSLGRPRALHDHEQLELLLESFTKQVEEIVSEIDNTVANIQSTQEIAELMLDSGRNALLALDIKISFATLGAGCAAVVAGVFGMNLPSHLESSPYAFYITTASASVFGLFIFIYGLRHLRRVRRVALSDRPRSKRGKASALAEMESLSKASWDRLPSVDPLTGDSRYINADLVRRSRAADKRIIWDVISRSKSRSEGKAGMEAWKAAQAAALARGRGWKATPPADGSKEGPVWMNSRADQARARDAYLAIMHQQGEERECALDPREAPEWGTAPWKWGRGKVKWNKD